MFLEMLKFLKGTSNIDDIHIQRLNLIIFSLIPIMFKNTSLRSQTKGLKQFKLIDINRFDYLQIIDITCRTKNDKGLRQL